jgi:hypothetical protein
MNQEILVKAINNLTMQVSQLSVDKALLQAELELVKEELANLKGEQSKQE